MTDIVAGWDALSGVESCLAAKPTEENSIWLLHNTQFKVRLIGNPVMYAQHFRPIEFRPEPDESYDDFVSEVPQTMYALWVIDRADSRLKIMDFSPGLFVKIGELAEKTGERPGGAHGLDVTIKGLDQIKHPSLTTLTALETQTVSGSAQRLLEARRPHTWNEVTNMLAAKGVRTFDRWDEI